MQTLAGLVFVASTSALSQDADVWPRALRISWDEKPCFDLEIAGLRVLGRLGGDRLAGPPR